MGKKDKSEKRKSSAADESVGDISLNDTATENKDGSYDDKVKFVSVIAQPLASRKLAKKLYKVTKKARSAKHLRKGVKEVQKCIRKGERGIVILAGDTNPIDVICHMPVYCEENNIPYCFTPSKEDIGAACGSKRPTCMVMVNTHADYADSYKELHSEIKSLPLSVS